MLACSAMVACTNTDEPEVDNGSAKGNEYYVSVAFSMPGNTSSRALGETPIFEDGTPDELAVKSVTFFFMNANGQSCADAFTLPNVENLKPWPGVDAAGKVNVDAESSPVIVMRNATEVPSSIVAILNTTLPTTIDKDRPSLTDLQGVIANYATSTYNSFDKDAGMVMSSTSYKDNNGDLVIGAPVSITNIYENRDKLTNALKGDKATAAMIPVVIPVEKVLAKVCVEQDENFAITEGSTTLGSLTDAGENATTTENDVELSVRIDGWWLDSTPTDSYLLKNMGFTGLTNSWWNDVANKRSYWAKSSVSANYYNYAYKVWAENKADLYCQENTLNNEIEAEDNDNVDDKNQRTKVVVAATLLNDGEPVSLVKWFGQYYTEAGFKATVANLSDIKKYYKKTSAEGVTPETYESLGVEDFEIVYNTDKTTNSEANSGTQDDIIIDDKEIRNYEAAVKILYDGDIYTYNNGVATVVEEEDLDDVENEILKITRMQYWNAGSTYYFVELEHSESDAAAKYGIVRNHLYNLTLNGVKGLGTPVPNPEKIIIPEKPGDSDMDTYISAKIEILSYRVVSQNVTLQ